MLFPLYMNIVLKTKKKHCERLSECKFFRNKMTKVKELITNKIDISLISETKLHQSFPNQQIHINGYWMFRSFPFKVLHLNSTPDDN